MISFVPRPWYIVLVLLAGGCSPKTDDYSTWKIKGGTADGIQYSSLRLVNKNNVSTLAVAWSYASHDADTVDNRTQIQCNPIVVDGVLYGTTASLHAFAVDVRSGKERWQFAPPTANPSLGVNRGVTYWAGENEPRILYSSGEFLYALDAKTGKPVDGFGKHGSVSLKEGLGERAANLMVLATTPGVVFNNLIIIGSRVHEGPLAAPGYIRAFDVRTGALVWTFHTIPMPGERGYETWPPDAWKKVGGANSWSGMTLDAGRGLVFAATGSASFDFYGGNRKGKNLFANCVLALDAKTGQRKWSYQIIHHDLWDRDLPAAPVLVTLRRDGRKIDAVAQVTKSGYVYLLDRDKGEPLFPVKEMPTPHSDLDGEQTWPSQPIPLKPPPFARQVFTESMISNVIPGEVESLKERFKTLRTGQPFIAPSKEGTIIFPGFDGGAEWGGPSFDPESGVLYVNANEMPWILTMVDVRLNAKTWTGISLYRTNCATCHGLERQGDGRAYPALDHLQQKYTPETLSRFIQKGKGVMPAFSYLSATERDAIARYVLDLQERSREEKTGIFERHPDILYSNTGYTRFVTCDGYPAVEPPWGTLTAIDLNAGTLKWQVPLGEFEELRKKGIPPTGSENYGGPIVTAGGLVFIAATRDGKIRAFDKDSGKILWEHPLPVAGYATPAMFEVDGRQILVIACGGGKLGTKSGDRYVAFALPEHR
jgi:quinoprotein glucose dehydrogenase